MRTTTSDKPRPFIDGYAAQWPGKPAVMATPSGTILTYRELDERSNQFARALRAAGLSRGSHVAYLVENGVRCFEIIWGAYRAGCYFTPVNTRLTAEEAAFIIHDSGAGVFVISARYGQLAGALRHLLTGITMLLFDGDPIEGYESYADMVGRLPTDPIPDESAGQRMYYTSGTTGRPRGVKRPLPEAPIGSGDAWLAKLAELYGWSEQTRYLCPAPLYHGAGLWFTTAMHQLGATVVVMEHFNPEQLLSDIERYRITCVQLVPTMFVRLLRLPESVRAKYDLSSLTHAIHAAAPCPPAVKEAMLAWWGPIIYEYYASTEGIGYCWIAPEEWVAHKGSVGRAILGIPHIVDDAGAERPVGEPGMIYFGGPGADFVYHNDEQKSRDARHPAGWSTCGDIGYLDAEGYLYLTDRRSNMIISGGVNIYPQEVENVLALHPAVEDVAVVGVPDPEFGESIKAVVQLRAGHAASTDRARELVAYCRDRLAHYKCPKTVDFADELPRGDNGKLYKREIRDRYRSDGVAPTPD